MASDSPSGILAFSPFEFQVQIADLYDNIDFADA